VIIYHITEYASPSDSERGKGGWNMAVTQFAHPLSRKAGGRGSCGSLYL
jgi:hypothetical protein